MGGQGAIMDCKYANRDAMKVAQCFLGEGQGHVPLKYQCCLNVCE